MKFSLWTDYGALNSKPVFAAFKQGAENSGHVCVENDSTADVDVIWSVLFHGRMSRNKGIWLQDKPTIVLEVGGIHRGTTWKVGLNGINRNAYFGSSGMDSVRSRNLGLEITPWRTEGEHILVCGQHDKSLQWQNQPSMSNWFLSIYDEIRKYTARPILFRPHPRCPLPDIEQGLDNVYRQQPTHLANTYDDFNLVFNNVWATVSYSSNPGIHSILAGVPAFVGPASLAYEVSNDIDSMHNIESPLLPDRQQWLNDYAHTEWTVDEISQGMPLKHLTNKL